MDKKNTMLLTVIAVATLLVAVVGATFAYFSIVQQGGSGSSQTTFTGDMADVGNYGTTTLNPMITNLKLTLSAADMSQSVATGAGENGKSYFASASKVNGDSLTVTGAPGNYEVQEQSYQSGKQNHVISEAKLAGQHNITGAEITCKSTVTITASGTMIDDATAKAVLTSGEKSSGKVYIAKALDDSTDNVVVTGGEIDLKDLVSAEQSKKEVQVTYKFKDNGSLYLTADVEFINTPEDQSKIAGKTLSIDITNNNFTCDVTAVGTPSE